MSAVSIVNCTKPVLERQFRHGLQCISASPNPEFANNPKNYGHFLLALVFPIFVAWREQMGDAEFGTAVQSLLIFHGHNRLATRWWPQWAQITSGRCIGHILRTSGAAVGCTHRLEISGATKYSFCSKAYWRSQALAQFAGDFRRLLLGMRRPSGDTHGVLVMQRPMPRNGTTTRGAAPLVGARGLHLACESSYAAYAAAHVTDGAAVSCLHATLATPLRQVLQLLSSARGIVGFHGAAMANGVFLRAGAALIELDALPNVRYTRNMHLDAASAVGARTAKLWTASSGIRVCPLLLARCSSHKIGPNLADRFDAALVRASVDEALFAAAHFERWVALRGAWRGSKCPFYHPRVPRAGGQRYKEGARLARNHSPPGTVVAVEGDAVWVAVDPITSFGV